MQTRVRMPARRVMGLAITETDNEVLIYDTEQHHIHHLNATTSAVWRACDGAHDINEIARLTSVTLGERLDEATVRLALTKLDDANLLADPLPTDLRAARLSRRTLMRRAGIAGAIAVPAIVSTTSPTAAGATTPHTCGYICQAVGDCAPGPCPDCNATGGNKGTCVSQYCPSPCTLDANCNALSSTCQHCVRGVCKTSQPGDGCGRPCSISNPCPTTGGCTTCSSSGFCYGGNNGSGQCGNPCNTSSDCAKNGGCPNCNQGVCSANTSPNLTTKSNLQLNQNAPAEQLTSPTQTQSPAEPPTPTQEPPTPTEVPPTPPDVPPTNTPTPEPPTPTPTDVPPTPTEAPAQDVVTTDQTQQDAAPDGTPDSSG